MKYLKFETAVKRCTDAWLGHPSHMITSTSIFKSTSYTCRSETPSHALQGAHCKESTQGDRGGSRISRRGGGGKVRGGGSKAWRPNRDAPLPREARKLSENTTISILKNAQNNHIYNIWDCKLNVHAAIETYRKHVFNHPFHTATSFIMIIIMIKLYAVGIRYWHPRKM